MKRYYNKDLNPKAESGSSGMSFRVILERTDNKELIYRTTTKSAWQNLTVGQKISVFKFGNIYRVPHIDPGGYGRAKWYFPIFGISMLLLGGFDETFHLRGEDEDYLAPKKK